MKRIGIAVMALCVVFGQFIIAQSVNAEGFPFAISKEFLVKSITIPGVSDDALYALRKFVQIGIEEMTLVEESGAILKIEYLGDLIVVSSKEFAVDTRDPGAAEIFLTDDPADQMISFVGLAREWGVLFVKEDGVLVDATAPCIESYSTEVLRKAFASYRMTQENLGSAREWYAKNRVRLIKGAMAETGNLYLTYDTIEKWFAVESAKFTAAIETSAIDVGFLEFKGGVYMLTLPPQDRT